MELEHLKYHSNGRTFQAIGKPGQFCYKSQTGQENVELNGEYYPYIKDIMRGILDHQNDASST